MSETRQLYKDGPLVITGRMETDDDQEDHLPDWDDDRDTAEDMRRRLASGDFEYVGMMVTVTYDGAQISSDALWRIEHGQISDDTVADAWETMADYPAPGTIATGSPLSDVISEAICHAQQWAARNGSSHMRQALARAEQWADPNRPAATGTAPGNPDRCPSGPVERGSR